MLELPASLKWLRLRIFHCLSSLETHIKVDQNQVSTNQVDHNLSDSNRVVGTQVDLLPTTDIQL